MFGSFKFISTTILYELVLKNHKILYILYV